MTKTLLIAATAIVALLAGLFATDNLMARKVVSGGKINGSVIMSCSNGMRENWVTYHAPGDSSFFHQELVLGEGDYTLSLIPSGSFRFNAFIYQGDARQYIGGRKSVGSYSQRLSVKSWSGKKFLVQMKKVSQSCRGCAVTMALTARNCPGKTNSPSQRSTAPLCKPNQCADRKGGLFGLPSCLYKKGARGGYCGTPGN
ncbi:MAG: hypothetical protein ABJN65_15025 [Parasphingorhabdus sp.]